MKPFSIVPLSQIFDKLPNDSLMRTHWKADNLDGSFAAYASSSVDVDALTLDAPFNNENIVVVFVEGNLNIRQYAFNEETDGSCSIIVTGDLSAGSLIVGGQEIYVSGNLEIRELFWGHYNHGDLTVHGHARANVFIETDEYHVNITGKSQWDKHISNWDEDGNWQDITPEIVAPILHADCFEYDEDDDSLILLRTGMYKLLQKGKSLLKKQKPVVAVPSVFGNYEANAANINRLMATKLIPEDKYELILYIDDVKATITRPYDMPGQQRGNSIYLLQDNVYSVFIKLQEDSVSIIYSDDPAEESKWFPLDANAPVVYQNLANHYWPALLKRVEYIESLKKADIKKINQAVEETVTVEKIQNILSLPLITDKYNDYNDADRNGYWQGNFHYAFRVNTDYYDRIQLMAQRSSKTFPLLPTVQDNFDMQGYQFDVVTDDSSTTPHVRVRYKPHNHSGESPYFSSRYLEVYEVDHLEKALRYWKTFEKNIYDDNERFVNPEAVLGSILGSKFDDGNAESYYEELAQQEDLTDKYFTLNGCRFRVITIRQADELLKDILTPGTSDPAYTLLEDIGYGHSNDKTYFLLAEDDVTMDAFELSNDGEEDWQIAGFIFLKDLNLNTYFWSFDTDFSPYVIVKGTLLAKNIYLAGTAFYFNRIQGELLYGFYNHGSLHCNEVDVSLVFADDFEMYIRKISNGFLVHTHCIKTIMQFAEEDGSIETLHDHPVPLTHPIRHVLLNELYSYNPGEKRVNSHLDREKLYEYFVADKSTVDVSAIGLYTDLPQQLPEIFNAIFSSEQLQKNESVKFDSLVIHGETVEQVFFETFEMEDQAGRQIGLYDFRNATTMRIVHNTQDNTWWCCYDVYSKDFSALQYTVETDINDITLENVGVRYGFARAAKAWNEQFS